MCHLVPHQDLEMNSSERIALCSRFTLTLLYVGLSAQHIRLQQASTVIHTTHWNDQQFTNTVPFKFALNAYQIHEHTNNRKLCVAFTSSWPATLTDKPLNKATESSVRDRMLNCDIRNMIGLFKKLIDFIEGQ